MPYTIRPPWQFHVDAIHKGKENSYAFKWNNRKVILLPSTPQSSTPSPTLLILSSNDFSYEAKECDVLFVIMYKELPITDFVLHGSVTKLLEEFSYLSHADLLEDLPFMRDIQQQIDLV